MNTVRYILFGAATGCACGWVCLWLTTTLLVDSVGLMSLMVIPAGLISGGLCGYRYAKTKRAGTMVVQVLPERGQDSTHATAA